jgi:hypothetical protein
VTNELIPTLTEEQRAKIHDSRSPYSAEDRLCAIMAYIVSGGNSEEAARKATLSMGQPLTANTLRQWKCRADWWPEGEDIARKMLQQDLGRKYTRILALSEKEIGKRLIDGDPHVASDGTVTLVPIKFRDLVTGHAIISDKRAMLYGEPTSRKEDTGLDLLLRLAQAMQKDGTKKIGETIDAEYEEVENAEFN